MKRIYIAGQIGTWNINAVSNTIMWARMAKRKDA